MIEAPFTDGHDDTEDSELSYFAGLSGAERLSVAMDMVMDAVFVLDVHGVKAAEFLEEMAGHYRNGLADVEGQA